jgi:hypothetical protein
LCLILNVLFINELAVQILLLVQVRGVLVRQL